MKIDTNTTIYALIGNPVAKSLSPFIHNYVFDFLNQNKIYIAHKVSKEILLNVLEGVKALGYVGINVTIPHKIDVIKYLDDLDETAKKVGAVNTIKIVEGKLIGYNTDGIGFLDMLEENEVHLSGKKVLVLGAGGAARAISITLAGTQISHLSVRNRTNERADLLIAELTQINNEVVFSNDSKKQSFREFDLVINTTSIGMFPNIDEIPIDLELINEDAILCDIVYKPHLTKFLKLGLEKGHKAVFGIEMLIAQALASQEIWQEMNVDKAEIKKELVENIIID